MAIGLNRASMAGCASGACGPQQCKTAACAKSCAQACNKGKGAGAAQQPDIQQILALLIKSLTEKKK